MYPVQVLHTLSMMPLITELFWSSHPAIDSAPSIAPTVANEKSLELEFVIPRIIAHGVASDQSSFYLVQ